MDLKKPLIRVGAAVGMAVMACSCSTSYDAYGRPQQTVDPGLAVAGMAAAALVGYAIADSNSGHRHHRGHHRGHYGGHHGGHYGGHYGGYHGGHHRGGHCR